MIAKPSRADLVVVLLTLVGFGLRLPGINDSLFGDELFLYSIARHDGLGSMLEAVHDTESTPPFHFVLAWAAAKLGDPTVTVRLPSLLLGTAVIPLTYLLGKRALSRSAATLGAAFIALSPFAIWYSAEARAYSTLTFLSALSTLGLLLALQTRRRRWWALYGIAAALVLYTHYMGVFVLIAQAAWAFWSHRERWRELVVVHVAVVIAYLPWLPSFVFQSDDTSATRISTFKDFTPKGAVRELVISFAGNPFAPLRDVPGRAAMVLLACGLAVAAVGAGLRLAAGERRGWTRSTVALVAVVALATPAGVALYSVVGKNTYIPRNLVASLPALCLLLGAAFAGMRRLPAVAGAAAIIAALAIGVATLFESRFTRPAYRQAAEFVDAKAPPGTVVLEYPLFTSLGELDRPLARHFEVHLEKPHLLLQARSPQSPAWDRVGSRRELFVVTPWDAAHQQTSPLPPRLQSRYRLVRKDEWDGLVPVAVLQYRVRAPGSG